MKNQCFATADGVDCHPSDVSYDVMLSVTSVSSISIEPNSIDMIAGNDSVLSVTILPATATDKSLLWLSSDESVATAHDGIVTAISSGTAIITAKATDGSNKQATATVNVYSDEDEISSVQAESEGSVYDVQGRKLPAPRRGLNILRMGDGTTIKKVIK